MNPATWPRGEPLSHRLLCVEPGSGRFADLFLRDLPDLLHRGDLLVVNDAATLPASLQATTSKGEPIEIRLALRGDQEAEWTAVLFGRGDWRMRTEDRPLPPPLKPGEVLRLGGDLAATIKRVWPVSVRLVDLVFDRNGTVLWEGLYRHGHPVQYSYLQGPLALWHVQNIYGARPWAVEPPSGGLPLSWELLDALKRRGIGLASVTHATGLSSTGDAAVDALLPLPEHFEIPQATVEAIKKARRRGGRVVAVGTSVVRALEGSVANQGGLEAGAGITDLLIGDRFQPRVVDGLLTGLHEPGTSHFSLLTAFARQELLMEITRHAERKGYLGHEFGDSMLVLGDDRKAETTSQDREHFASLALR